MSLRGLARRLAAAAMAVLGDAPARRLVHRFPHTLPGRAVLADALLRRWQAQGRRGPETAALRNGLALSVPVSREGASHVLAGCLMGDAERRIAAMFDRFLRPGDVFFDVGSHLGFYSLLAAGRTAPDGRIHTFEAQPWLVDYLNATVALNRLDGRMSVSHAAVVATDGEAVTIFPARDADNTGSASILESAGVDTGQGAPVAGLSLDAYVARTGVAPIDAMKIDVEGAEAGVLAGMTRIFAEMPPGLIMVELSFGDGGAGPADREAADGQMADGGRQAIAILRDAGYTMHRIRRDGRLGPAIADAAFAPGPLENLAFARAGLKTERPDMFAG